MENRNTRGAGRLRLRVAGVLLLLSVNGTAQEALRGEIFYAEGNDFAITTDGRRHTYRAESLADEGLLFVQGDMLQTGPGSFTEIQLIPGGTVIKIAENTTLEFNGREEGGGAVRFSLIYGRFRLVTGPESEEGGIVVLAGGASLSVQNGDIGIDYTIHPGYSVSGMGNGTQPLLRVYGFRGSAGIRLDQADRGGGAVYGTGAVSSGQSSVIPVNELELVSLEALSSLYFVERKSLDTEIVGYWDRNNFKGSPPVAIPDTALPPMVVSGAGTPESPPVRPVPRQEGRNPRTLLKNDAILFSLPLLGIGVGMQAYGAVSLYAGNYFMAEQMNTWSFFPIGLGLVFLITSMIFNLGQF